MSTEVAVLYTACLCRRFIVDSASLAQTAANSGTVVSINGQLADVYSPSGSNVLTVRDNVVGKVEHQAPNVVVNLQDSKLSMSDVV